jgi:hypothetical protein
VVSTEVDSAECARLDPQAVGVWVLALAASAPRVNEAVGAVANSAVGYGRVEMIDPAVIDAGVRKRRSMPRSRGPSSGRMIRFGSKGGSRLDRVDV